MVIGFIGAGKVGTAFGMYLKSKGLSLSGYYSKSPSSSQRAAHMTSSCQYISLGELCEASDIIFITTNDSEIEQTCAELCKGTGLRRNQILLHMSGALSIDVLKCAKELGCHTFSLHPMQAFADIENALMALPNTFFSIEGLEDGDDRINLLLKAMGNPYFVISSDSKALYHAAACIFSNHLVTLMEQGLRCFDKIGIERDKGFEAVLPLILSTLNNIKQMGTAAALTGPIARGDGQTVEKHVASLERDFPEGLSLYREAAYHTLQLALKKKLEDQDKANEIEKILKD